MIVAAVVVTLFSCVAWWGIFRGNTTIPESDIVLKRVENHRPPGREIKSSGDQKRSDSADGVLDREPLNTDDGKKHNNLDVVRVRIDEESCKWKNEYASSNSKGGDPRAISGFTYDRQKRRQPWINEELLEITLHLEHLQARKAMGALHESERSTEKGLLERLDSGLIEVQKIHRPYVGTAGSPPGPQPRPMEVTATYNWRVRFRDDPGFRAWDDNYRAIMEESRGGKGTGVDATYEGPAQFQFELLPPIAIPPHQTARVSIELGGIYDSCGLRFGFCLGATQVGRSEWFGFRRPSRSPPDCGTRSVIPTLDFRMWTDVSGNFDVEAKFGGMSSGGVRLLRRDGREVVVPLERLSPSDQRMIRVLTSRK